MTTNPIATPPEGRPLKLPAIDGRRQKLSDRVYDVLCDHIVQGELLPGRRLREAEMAEALGVSRTPVREALARLEQQHLIQREPGGAYTVASWDKQMLWEVATFRSALEELAHRLTCQKLRAADFVYLEELIAQMEIALRQDDYQQLIALDIQFHSYIWQKTEHTLLQAALEGVKAQLLYFMYLTRPAGNEPEYPATHRQVIEALKQRDPVRAAAAIREHTLASAEYAIASLPDG